MKSNETNESLVSENSDSIYSAEEYESAGFGKEIFIPNEELGQLEFIKKSNGKSKSISEKSKYTLAGKIVDSSLSDGYKSIKWSKDIKEGKEEKKKEYLTYKFSQDIPLAESLLINNVPYFLQIIKGKSVLSLKIDLGDITIVPPDRTQYLSKEYSFSSVEELNEYIKRSKQETLGTLYTKVKGIWQKYIDAEEKFLVLCSADTIFTYFQDILGMTHYLLFVGDNDTGKSNVLSVFYFLGYRPISDTSITPANIYNFLESLEEGQGIILEDEIDNIDEQEEKKRIYKAGYKKGTKVSRMYELSNNKKKFNQQGFYTYGFKAFCSEKQPSIQKSKGFIERLLTLKCSPGNPHYDISEVHNEADDELHRELLNELLDIRKMLFIYRLLHHNHSYPDIKLTVTNRDKQLSKPLIRLFQNTKVINEIIDSLSYYLTEKKDKKINSFDSRLYLIVIDLTSVHGFSISNELLWDEIKKQIPGKEIPDKPQSYYTEEYGMISKNKITSICEDKFDAKKDHDGQKRILLFNQKTLYKLSVNYARLVDKIEIINDVETNTFNTFNTFWDHIEKLV